MHRESKEWIELIRFVEPFAGSSVSRGNQYNRDTDLHHDLDLEPEKIQKMLNSWSIQFGVDMTKFDLHHYYPANKLSKKDFFLTLGRVFFSKKARETIGGSTLTLGMMEEAMLKKKWEI